MDNSGETTPISMESKLKTRLDELIKERDGFTRTAQEQVTKMKADLDATMAQANSLIASYNGAIGEFEKLLTIEIVAKEVTEELSK